jgi:LysM repeat protein
MAEVTDLKKPLDLEQVSDYLTSLMVLKQVEAENDLDPYFKHIADTETSADKAPISLISKGFTPENALEVKLLYPDVWKTIHDQVKERNMKSQLVTAGYSEIDIDSIPDNVIQHFATVDVFEEHFPDKDHQKRSLIVRLREGKDELFEALNSEAGRKTLSAVSLGISLATGGIVTRLALRGGAFVAAQIIQNESVQDFAGKMQSRMTNFMERMGVPTGVIGKRLLEMKENAKHVLASDTFQKYGKPSLALAGIAFGVMLLGEVNHDKLIDLASTGLNKSIDVASTGLDLGLQGAHAANEGLKSVAEFAIDAGSTGLHATGEALSTAADVTVEAGSVVASAVADSAVAAYDVAGDAIVAAPGFIADAASTVSHATGDAIVAAPGFIADAASTVYHATGDAIVAAPGFVADGVSTAYHTTTDALIEGGRAVVDGATVAGEYVADAAVNAYDVTGHAIVAGSDAVVDGVKTAGVYVADTAVGAYDATGEAIASATDASRNLVADSLHGVASHLNGAGDYVAVNHEVVAPGDHVQMVAGNADHSATFMQDQSIADRGAAQDATVPGALAPQTAEAPVESIVPAATDTASTPVVHHIEKGESLWRIAKEQFEANGVHATNGQIQEATKALYEANKDLIGSNPDLIFAGKAINIDPSIFEPHAVATPVVAAPHMDGAITARSPDADLAELNKLLGSNGIFPSSMVVPGAPVVSPADLGLTTGFDPDSPQHLQLLKEALNTPPNTQLPEDPKLQAQIEALLSDTPHAADRPGAFKAAVDKITDGKATDFTPGS